MTPKAFLHLVNVFSSSDVAEAGELNGFELVMGGKQERRAAVGALDSRASGPGRGRAGRVQTWNFSDSLTFARLGLHP
jgi:hypothetical protein